MKGDHRPPLRGANPEKRAKGLAASPTTRRRGSSGAPVYGVRIQLIVRIEARAPSERRCYFSLMRMRGSATCAAAGAVLFGAFFTAFLLAVFLAAAFCCCALAALTAAHRFFVAATILAKPSLLIRRLGLGASLGAGGSATATPLIAAHRFFCAIAMRRRAAAETL